MPHTQPHVIVLAGPNGAGKSTSAPFLLEQKLALTEFVNADTIAQGLSAFAPENVSIAAGRIMLERLKTLAASHQSFAFETTLASRSFAPWIESLLDHGYHFDLVFLWLPSPEHAVARVADRVRVGGHHIPESTVRRRYDAGLRNFFQLYRPLTTSWRIYDNSDIQGLKLIAAGSGITTTTVFAEELWSKILLEYHHDREST